MKKNKMMRVASALLIAVLLTTSAISGTFAKYVTQDSAADSARVAKFGVVLDVNGSLFDKTYLNVANGNTPGGEQTANLTVISSNDDNLVAPGTQNDEGLTFSIKGTPEVAVKLEAKLIQHDDSNGREVAPNDIYLEKGTYRDWTVSGQNTDYPGTFTIGAIYYPVVFTLKETTGSGAYSIYATARGLTTGMSNRWGVTQDGSVTTVTGTLGDLNKLFAALSTAMANLGPNYPFDNVFQLTWKWDFEQGDNTSDGQAKTKLYDKADTLLGNLAAKEGAFADGTAFAFAEVSAADESSNPASFKAMGDDSYNLNIDFDFSISITQID